MRILRSTLLVLTFIINSFLAFSQTDSTQLDQGIYNGKTKSGDRHGYGVCTWKDGRRYEGKWKYNLMNGKGTMTYKNGDKYYGDWKNGAKTGYGKYTWSGGSVYEGAFLNGKKHGWGILRESNGSKHEGYWKNDMANGKGKHVWANGTQYYGDWKNNQRDGSGVLEYSDGGVVQGEWKADQYIPCQCTVNTDSLNAEDIYQVYEAIFVGTVVEIYQDENGKDAIVFEISQHWKGKHGYGRKIILHAGFRSCDFIFYEGDSYLIFANTGNDKFYRADKCSPSGELKSRISLIQSLQKLDCKQDPVKQPFEIRDFDPVCGCDGKTYNNPYKAKANGVGSWKKGACKK